LRTICSILISIEEENKTIVRPYQETHESNKPDGLMEGVSKELSKSRIMLAQLGVLNM